MKKKLKRPEPEWARLPLLPEHGINFMTDGHGDAEKFIRVFRNTWNRLPSENRRQLLKYWQKRSLPKFKRPHIDLANWMSDFNLDERHDKGKYDDPEAAAYATCSGDGTHLAFWQPVMDQLPDEHAISLIAHELAHALIIISLTKKKNPDLDDPDMIHAYIRKYLSMIGIDEDAMRQWVTENAPELVKGQKGLEE